MKNYFKALAAFQQECPSLLKSTKGYGYNYVEINNMIAKINPYLSKHKLGFTQPLVNNPATGNLAIKTVIFHTESGEYSEEVADIPQGVELKGMNAYQSTGAGVTYFRRYCLASTLGLVSDKDTDGDGVEKPKQRISKPKLSASMLNEILKGTRDSAIKAVGSFDLTSEQKETLKNKFK